MRLKSVIYSAVAVIVIGMATATCGTMKPDPNSYEFVNSRRDG